MATRETDVPRLGPEDDKLSRILKRAQEIPVSEPPPEEGDKLTRILAKAEAIPRVEPAKPAPEQPGAFSRLTHEKTGRLSLLAEASRVAPRAVGRAVESAGGVLQGTASRMERAAARRPAFLLPEELGGKKFEPKPSRLAAFTRGAGEVLEETGAETAEFYPRSTEADPLNIWDPNTFVATVGEAVAQLGGQLALAAGTGGAGSVAQFLAFAGPTAIQEGGGAYLETRDRLLEGGASQEEAERVATGVGSSTGLGALALERIPAARFVFGKIPGSKKIFGAKMATALAGRGGHVTNMLSGAAAEGTEEALQEAWGSLIDDIQGKNPEAWKDIEKRLVVAGVSGAGAGTIAGAVTGRGAPETEAAPEVAPVAPPEAGEAPPTEGPPGPAPEVTEPPTAPAETEPPTIGPRTPGVEAELPGVEKKTFRRRIAEVVDPTVKEELLEAYTDAKTGVANQQAWEAARERIEADPGQEVVLVDLRNFKAVNDLNSMEAGDQKLREVAEVLKGMNLPTRDIFRAGGDEFTVAVPTGSGQDVGIAIEAAIGETEILDTEGNPTGIQFGARFGVGQTFDQADQAAKVAKAQETGERFRTVEPAPISEGKPPEPQVEPGIEPERAAGIITEKITPAETIEAETETKPVFRETEAPIPETKPVSRETPERYVEGDNVQVTKEAVLQTEEGSFTISPGQRLRVVGQETREGGEIVYRVEDVEGEIHEFGENDLVPLVEGERLPAPPEAGRTEVVPAPKQIEPPTKTGEIGPPPPERAVTATDAATRTDQLVASTAALDHFAATVGDKDTLRSYLETADGRTFLKELATSGVIAENERARFIDAKKGTATEEGKTMLERLFYSAAIGDPDIVARAPAGVLQKLDTSLPAIIAADQTEGWEIGETIGGAVDFLSSARATGQSVGDLASQVDFTRPSPPASVVEMAKFLDEKPKKAIRDAFRAYAKDAATFRREGESEDLFGFKPRTPAEAKRSFYALMPHGPTISLRRHFGVIPTLVRSVQEGETHALAPFQQLSETLPAAQPFVQQGEGKNVVSPVQTIEELRASLSKVMQGLKSAEGIRPKRDALGIFKARPQVIRLQDVSDVTVFGHEAGHAMEQLFFGFRAKGVGKEAFLVSHVGTTVSAELTKLAQGISDESVNEGWAEAWRLYLDNRKGLKVTAPETFAVIEKGLDDFPGVREAWNLAQNQWQTFREGGALARVQSKISLDEKPNTLTIQDLWSRMRTNYLDVFEPLRQLVEFARTKGEVTPEEDVETLARLSAGASGQGIRFLERGTVDFNTFEKIGKSLKAVLEPIQTEVEDFRAYIVSKRAVELHQRDKLTGFRDQDVRQVVQEMEAKHGVTFQTAFRELQTYNRQLLEYLRDAGVVSDKSLKAILELNQNYVPFYRIMDDDAGVGGMSQTFGHLFSPVKRIHGSGRDIIDPLESIVKNTMLYTNLAARQEVSNALASLATKQGIGEHLEKVVAPMKPTKFNVGEIAGQLDKAVPGFSEILTKLQERAEAEWAKMTKGMSVKEIAAAQKQGILPDGPADPAEDLLTIFRPGEMFRQPNVISVLQGDKRKWFEVDPELFKSLQGMEREQVPGWARFMSIPARTLRAGATLSPEFQLRNPFRDQIVAYVQSEYGYKPGIDLVRGIFELARKGEAYEQWLSSGGMRASLLALDRKTQQQNVRDLMKSGGVPNVVKDPLDMLRAWSAFMEDGTRMGEFLRARAELGTSKRALQKAGSASREVSIDFNRHGNQLAAIRAMAAFWNARLQGYARLGRAFRDHPVRATSRAFVAITLPTLIEYALNRDDEDYHELAQWRKDLFWNLRLPDWVTPGDEAHFLALPKPFELGLIFGTLPARLIEWMDKDDPHGLQQFFDDTLKREVEGFVPFPTAVEPLIENLTNHSFFYGRDIDTRAELNIKPKFRGESTASEASKMLARWLPGEGVSPRKIDNVLFAYTGGLGRHATQATDFFVDVAKGEVRPARSPLQTIPGIKGVVTGEGGFNSESVQRFYDELARARTAKGTLKHFKDTEKWDAYDRELTDEDANRLRSMASHLESTSRRLSSLRAERNMIFRDRTMMAQAKKTALLDLGRIATEVARDAFELSLTGEPPPKNQPSGARPTARSR